jgi:hypothetical protein
MAFISYYDIYHPNSSLHFYHGRAYPEPTEVTRSRLAWGRHELLVRSAGQVVTDTSWVDLEELSSLCPLL